MKTIHILINSIEQIKEFVNDTNKINADLDLVSERYIINAKSIMGIFSLNLSKPILMNIYAEGIQLKDILKVMKKYMVK
ncbi:MAG: HPr family phosphocarrier protein [Anaerocolumna sp.]